MENKMILVIDIGNTNITAAIFRDDSIVFDFRLATDKNKSADEYFISIKSIIENAHIQISEIINVVVCSVVPAIDRQIELTFNKYFKISPYFIKVQKNIRFNINIDVDNPEEVGADRITNAEYCALNHKGKNVIVIDFGTATTFDVVLKNGSYTGGIIAPGIALSAKALFETAAKLFPVNYDILPEKIIGKNSRDAMISGIVNGYAAMTEGLLDRIIESTGIRDWLIIATGGFSNIFQKLTNRIDIIDDKITLKGAKLIFENNLPNLKGFEN